MMCATLPLSSAYCHTALILIVNIFLHFVRGTRQLRGIEIRLYSAFNGMYIFLMYMKSCIVCIEVGCAILKGQW